MGKYFIITQDKTKISTLFESVNMQLGIFGETISNRILD